MEQNDGLSQWLCLICFNKIEEFIKFRRKCHETVQKYKCLIEIEPLPSHFDPLIETLHQKEETEIFLDNTETETIILDLKKEENLETFFEKIDNPDELLEESLEPEVQINEMEKLDSYVEYSQQNYQCQWCEKSYTKRSNLSR